MHFFFLQAGQFWTVAKQYQLIIIFFDLDYASPTMYGGWKTCLCFVIPNLVPHTIICRAQNRRVPPFRAVPDLCSA